MSIDYLKSQVDIVVENRCVSCHDGVTVYPVESAKAGQVIPDLGSTTSLVGAGHIIEGDPGSSNFYRRFIDFDRVEYEGLLSSEELGTIRDWICVLSETNTCGLIVPIGFDPALLDNAPIATLTQLRAEVFNSVGTGGYGCTDCHNGNAGRPQFNDYNSILMGVVPGNPAGSVLYQKVASGDMPRNNSGPLSAEDKVKIYTWIRDGAKNN